MAQHMKGNWNRLPEFIVIVDLLISDNFFLFTWNYANKYYRIELKHLKLLPFLAPGRQGLSSSERRLVAGTCCIDPSFNIVHNKEPLAPIHRSNEQTNEPTEWNEIISLSRHGPRVLKATQSSCVAQINRSNTISFRYRELPGQWPMAILDYFIVKTLNFQMTGWLTTLADGYLKTVSHFNHYNFIILIQIII